MQTHILTLSRDAYGYIPSHTDDFMYSHLHFQIHTFSVWAMILAQLSSFCHSLIIWVWWSPPLPQAPIKFFSDSSQIHPRLMLSKAACRFLSSSFPAPVRLPSASAWESSFLSLRFLSDSYIGPLSLFSGYSSSLSLPKSSLSYSFILYFSQYCLYQKPFNVPLRLLMVSSETSVGFLSESALAILGFFHTPLRFLTNSLQIQSSLNSSWFLWFLSFFSKSSLTIISCPCFS